MMCGYKPWMSHHEDFTLHSSSATKNEGNNCYYARGERVTHHMSFDENTQRHCTSLGQLMFVRSASRGTLSGEGFIWLKALSFRWSIGIRAQSNRQAVGFRPRRNWDRIFWVTWNWSKIRKILLGCTTHVIKSRSYRSKPDVTLLTICPSTSIDCQKLLARATWLARLARTSGFFISTVLNFFVPRTRWSPVPEPISVPTFDKTKHSGQN